MKILIVGSGGREHALTWKISQSPKVKKIYIVPGNAGTALVGENLEITTTEEIVSWLRVNYVDLVIVGTDSYLAEGLVDKIQELKISVFGPTKAAAEIEWSKSFAKELMKEENIPTAKYRTVTSYKEAKEYVARQKFPLVIKADGLAFGKGVVIAQNLPEAEMALKELMEDRIHGDAGSEVIIEEYLEGEEISTHAFCDGQNAMMFPSSQDHKRIFENDEGPNTGGMGTIAPVPGVTTDMLQEIKEKIVLPTLEGLKKRGRPFTGVLFPGIMITKDGPKVIEFNARFGDPETQSYMRILETDLVDIMFSCVNGTLNKQNIIWSNKSACCVVLASGGYPGSFEKGKIVSELEKLKDEDVEVFHAGTKSNGTDVLTNGGRVLGVTATGVNLEKSLAKAYRAIELVNFDGMQYRKDIGFKVTNKEV